MKPTWQAWIERWLGVDATFLAAALVHVGLSWLLPWLLTTYGWARPYHEDASVLCTGWIASSAAILGLWTVCGSGRLAIRCLWAVILASANWYVLARAMWVPYDIWAQVTAAVGLIGGVLSLGIALVLRLGWGTLLTRANAVATDAAAERWRFRVVDLLILMVVVSIVVAGRFWLEDFGPLFYEFGAGVNDPILYAIRFGGALCAATVLAGAFSLMRDKPRVIWTVLTCAMATVLAVLLVRLPFGESTFGDLLRLFGVGAMGSLLATLATFLQLRASGWRCVSTNRMPPPNR
jgi:hypothetical protein